MDISYANNQEEKINENKQKKFNNKIFPTKKSKKKLIFSSEYVICITNFYFTLPFYGKKTKILNSLNIF